MLAYKKLFSTLFEELRKVVIGQDRVVEQILIAILSGGNALLEGYPGLAKTLTVKTIAKSMNMNFSRIQFTPDLMPSDITGTYVLEEMDGAREFKFRPGPIFANIVLADEINRASPKTQSALLESMQEKQVTLGSTTYKLDKPFFVLATQNPIEQEGSLSLDQHVFIDGKLKKGSEVLKSLGRPVHEEEGRRFYETDSWTMALNAHGRLERARCNVYTVDYRKNMMSLTTETGKKIKVTKNHPFLVNENGVICWKKAEDLTSQDYLVNPAKITFENKNFKILRHKAAGKIRADCDFAFWIAAVAASGKITETSVEISQPSKSEEFEKFVRISKSYGHSPETTRHEGFVKARINSKELAEFLSLQLGFSSGETGIPQNVLGMPEDMNREFIRTFVSLSHRIVKDNLALFQTESNANILSYMLLREGIVSWISRMGDIFRMEIRGADLSRYIKRIGHLDKSELRRMKSFSGMDRTFRKVPIQRKDLLKMMSLVGFDDSLGEGKIRSRKWYRSYKKVKQGETFMEEECLRGLVEAVEKQLDEVASSGFVKKTKVISKKISVPVGEKNILSRLAGSDAPDQKTQEVKEGKKVSLKIQIKSMILEKKSSQLDEAVKVLSYLRGLLTDNVFYDRIESIALLKAEQKAFGLTVPGLKNYLGGFGGCGINHNTYPLPEAQSDRFLLKINADYPVLEDEIKIVDMYSSDSYETIPEIAMNKTDVLDLQQLAKQVPIANDLKRKVVNLVTSTRKNKKIIEYGASPRASIGMVVASKARALINGRNHVSKEDIVSVAYPVLRHRIALNFETERKGITPDDVIQSLTKKIK